MRASRGMGDINPSKMPKGKVKARRDDTDFTQYAKGGEVWDKDRPKDAAAATGRATLRGRSTPRPIVAGGPR